MPKRFTMGIVSEHRPNGIRNSGSSFAISLKDAVSAFREWNSSSIPLHVFFLGKAAPSDGVRVSLHGQVTRVDSQNIVTVSGGGREIQLDLNVCRFSIERDPVWGRNLPHPFDLRPALHLAFPNGAVCLIVPRAPDSRRKQSSRWIGSFRQLRRKLAESAPPSTPVKDPSAAPTAKRTTKRNLCVDVHHGQANIVEVLDEDNGGTRIRRLKEQFLSLAERTRANRLKRTITFGENGGSYELEGLYPPRTAHSAGELLGIVEELERQDGSAAWDRRRYPR